MSAATLSPMVSEVPLGPTTQIPLGEGRVFSVGGEEIAVFHTRSGQVYATQAECPHRQGPLADGLLGGTTLLCPLHAWKFNITTGEALMGTCGLKTYPMRLTEANEMWLTFDPESAPPNAVSPNDQVGADQAPVGSAVGPANG